MNYWWVLVDYWWGSRCVVWWDRVPAPFAHWVRISARDAAELAGEGAVVKLGGGVSVEQVERCMWSRAS